MMEPVDKRGADLTARNPIGLLPEDQRTVMQLLAIIGALILLSTSWFAVRHRGLMHIETSTVNRVTLEIDINKADWTEISALPKIGEATARDIVAYRNRHGPFNSLQSLLMVNGIGSSTLHSIGPYLGSISSREELVAEHMEANFR